jgi:hypothetical protein
MKSKSIILLTIFLLGLIPIYPAHAEDSVQRSLDDAVAFMYISDALLTEESELDDSSSSIGALSPSTAYPLEVDTNPLLARIIHSKKMQRNDLDAVCKLLTSRLRGEGKECEANKVQSHCDERRAEINSQIGFYHKMRGDQRKLFTRIWHSIKRNSSNFWHRIGPVGRNFLRQVGPAALQMATTGGLNSSALKNLIKHTAKSMGRERIKQVVYQGVQRLLQSQIDLALAAGVDICDPDSELSSSEREEKAGNNPLAGKRTWECEDIDGVMRNFRDQDQSPAAKILENEFGFLIEYDASKETVAIDYQFYILMEWGIYQTDGTLGQWHEITTQYSMTGSVDRVYDSGYFETQLKGEEFRKDTFLGSEVTLESSSNIFGLINPDDVNWIYICEVGANPLPAHNESATPENFKALCNRFYYYQCKLK